MGIPAVMVAATAVMVVVVGTATAAAIGGRMVGMAADAGMAAIPGDMVVVTAEDTVAEAVTRTSCTDASGCLTGA